MKRKRQTWLEIMEPWSRMRCVQSASEEIRTWAGKVGWPELLEVPCRPEAGLKEGNCFANVGKMVERHGGAPCFGHMLVEIPGQAIQAEAHAVWEDPSGSLVDITEKGFPVPKILFAPDRRIKESRGFTAGEYLPLSKDPRVLRLLEFERGLEQWDAEQARVVEPTNLEDPAQLDFASLRSLIAEARLPSKLAGTFLEWKSKMLGILPREVVPGDIRRLMEA